MKPHTPIILRIVQIESNANTSFEIDVPDQFQHIYGINTYVFVTTDTEAFKEN